MINIIRMLVEFTPTQKDDEFLDYIEVAINKDPVLAKMVFEIVLKLIKYKRAGE